MKYKEDVWNENEMAKSQTKVPDIHIITRAIPIKMDNTHKYYGKTPWQLGHVYYGLYVYSDIIEPIHVGDTLTQLLRFVEIPNGYKFGDQVVLSYPDTQYIPVNKNEIDMIEIEIKNEYGELFPFEYGRSIITLHFRQINKSEILPNNFHIK